MEFLLSFFQSSTVTQNTDIVIIPSESETVDNTVDKIDKIDKIDNNKIAKLNVKYSNEVQTINEFLIKSKHSVHKPGGGGSHDLKDKRVRKLLNDALSQRTYHDFLDDINCSLPVLLKREMKRQNLTMGVAKKSLTNYLNK